MATPRLVHGPLGPFSSPSLGKDGGLDEDDDEEEDLDEGSGGKNSCLVKFRLRRTQAPTRLWPIGEWHRPPHAPTPLAHPRASRGSLRWPALPLLGHPPRGQGPC